MKGKKGKITIREEFCKECHFCINVCPQGHIAPAATFNSRGYRPIAINPEGKPCTGCGLCALMCPDIVIEVYRE